jgi:hypothetical protein
MRNAAFLANFYRFPYTDRPLIGCLQPVRSINERFRNAVKYGVGQEGFAG